MLGDTVVEYSAFGLPRNKEVWREVAEAFRPEGWFEETEGDIKANEAAVDLVWDMGGGCAWGRMLLMLSLIRSYSRWVVPSPMLAVLVCPAGWG